MVPLQSLPPSLPYAPCVYVHSTFWQPCGTVNVAWHVVVNGAQALVYVNVTTLEPPQASGPTVPPLLLRAPLHPPLDVAVASHATKAAFTWTWVRLAAMVVLVGQTSDTAGGFGTVNVAAHVVVNGAQALVYVNVTVAAPPQLDGAAPALLLRAPAHPPLEVAVASHAVKAAFTWACV